MLGRGPADLRQPERELYRRMATPKLGGFGRIPFGIFRHPGGSDDLDRREQPNDGDNGDAPNPFPSFKAGNRQLPPLCGIIRISVRFRSTAPRP